MTFDKITRKTVWKKIAFKRRGDRTEILYYHRV